MMAEQKYKSLPTRERGLKLSLDTHVEKTVGVAPYTGAWIEMYTATYCSPRLSTVAPYTGAWIEIWPAMPFSDASTRRSLHGSVD